MAASLDGQVTVVTGAGAYSDRALGIGEAVCQRFLADGATVYAVDRRAEMIDRLVDQLNGPIVPIEADVTSKSSLSDLADRIRDEQGRLDILVNNAAIRVDSGPITETNDERFGDIIDVNLRGVANVCAALLPVMITSGGGRIVNVSSVHATIGREGWAQYDATKSALLAFTRDLACDHAADGIRVNSVSPGHTVTDYHLQSEPHPDRVVSELTSRREDGPGILKRSSHPEEQAAAIHFLASEASSFITGTNLPVDGGTHAV